MFLKGIRIYNYRSIDEKGIELDNLGKVNVLIGKNNAGKSNIIRFVSLLQDFLSNQHSNQFLNWINDSTNYFDYTTKEKMNFSLSFYIPEYVKLLIQKEKDNFFIYILNNLKKAIFIDYTITGTKDELKKELNSYKYEDLFHPELLSKLKVGYGKNVSTDYVLEMIRDLNIFSSIETFFIDSFRKINNSSSAYDSTFDVNRRSKLYNGDEVVGLIRKIKSPSPEEHYLEDKFTLFQNFVRDILNNDELEIDVTEKNELTIKLNKLSKSRRRIESLGTGIHQLIILSFAAVYNSNSIFCIEEPEIFVHPEVQRKFIRFLVNNTNNQYFITTHSSSFINEEGVNVYFVRHDGYSTKVDAAITSLTKNQILNDLGYLASDLLQTNFIIWVEGPSDRIYIRHWIEQSSNNELIEGVHYTIMFYGGRLLFHLSIDDETVQDFINISKINRHSAIFIDSDKHHRKDKINETKQRIVNEFENAHMFCLVTEGREIENYISANVLNAALSNVQKEHEDVEYDLFKDIFDTEKKIDKIKLAKEVIKIHSEVFETAGLKDRITELVKRVKEANDLG